eukprot:TRINITY_DN11868_c0_g1_i5.p1 TRINITY_DN11868_c0_g1~~TRINITY_DN11868_c0_g1_i5.p1  ORF type:complete len:1029 (-),score=115.11 TRINITY_DN11868_c0_g1_i5:97-3183(-)
MTRETLTRRLNTTCVTNFYPITFRRPPGLACRGTDSDAPQDQLIRIYHCSYFCLDLNEPARPREETELKRQIFHAPRQEGRQRTINDALGVRCLEFGGDNAAGLYVGYGDDDIIDEDAPDESELVPDDVDRYEICYNGDWFPAVIREILPEGMVCVELYALGSFWIEGLNRTGPYTVPVADVRLRRWEVCRGEALRVPDGATLCVRRGQHLWVRSRGPVQQEPAGRILLSTDSTVIREPGGVVENEGVLESIVELKGQNGFTRKYKFVVESIKTMLVESVPFLAAEERGVLLQAFTWIFERAYRQMQMKTLGGRGWYLAVEGTKYPEESPNVDSDRRTPPRIQLYRGFSATAVQVARGPCLKVELSTRMIQGQTTLAKLNFLRDVLLQKHKDKGLPQPTKSEMDAFLQSRMRGRTCMTRHNHVHYRIQRVCIDMDPTHTFLSMNTDISYLEYFQQRHGIKLKKCQPLLYCPFRSNKDTYIPSELAFLTGIDEDWTVDRMSKRKLWRALRHDPVEHWRLQSRLTNGLADPVDGAALYEWGLSVSPEPLRVNCGQLEHDPVYFSRNVHDYFRQAKKPPSDFEVPTSSFGFKLRPWPQVWTAPGRRIVFDKWIIMCSSKPKEREFVDMFIAELEPLVGEVLQADMQSGRIVITSPEVVTVQGKRPEEWAEFLRNFTPAWPIEETSFVLVVVPAKVHRHDEYYYAVKDSLGFGSKCSILSQVVLSSTLRRDSQRQRIWKNLLQHMLMKRGGWFWVISPLPYRGRTVMVIGFDARRPSKESPAIQTMCATTNPYFTQCYSTWRRVPSESLVCGSGESSLLPGELFKEAMLHFFQANKRLPDTVIVYRGGVSESQESQVIENEIYQPEGGLLHTLTQVADEVTWCEADLAWWKERFEIAYIFARRSTSTRFRTEDGENLPCGSFIDEGVVKGRDVGPLEPKVFDFYMVSQSFVACLSKPTLYSVLYNTLTLSKLELIQLTFRLCSVYQAFSGPVSTPAPLKYATKLVSLLSKCENLPREPPPGYDKLKSCLFFV